MIAWIKRLLGIKPKVKPFGEGRRNYPLQTFAHEYGSGKSITEVGAPIVHQDFAKLEARVIGTKVVMDINDGLPKRTKKQKKLSREQRRKQKAAKGGMYQHG